MPEKVARTYTLQVRLTPQEKEKLKSEADALGMRVSSYVRMLLSISVQIAPKSFEESESAILVLDTKTLGDMQMQLRRWGYHLDNALKALNTVAAKHFLSQQDTYDLVTEATEYIKDVSDLKESLATQINFLIDRESVRVNHPIEIQKDPNSCTPDEGESK